MLTDIRVTGHLRIVVLKARHLQNRRKLEKQNPYVTLRIGHIVETTSVDYRGGQTPIWDDECRFELTPDLEPVLQLAILDETKKTPTLVAEKKIDITPAFERPPDIGYDKWYTVEYAGKEAGEIFLEMTFYPSAPKVPLKIPIKNRMVIKGSQNGRPLPSLPGQDSVEARNVHDEIAEDILVKSFSSSMINRKLPTRPLPETIPLDEEDQPRLPISKTESHLNERLVTDIDRLFLNDSNDQKSPREFLGFKKFTNKLQQFQDNSAPVTNSGGFFKKKPTSPKKSLFSRFGQQHQQQSQTNLDDFDLLEQQVLSDWEQNHPNEFQEAINRRFGKKTEEEEEDKTSSWTRSISSLNKNEKPLFLDIESDSEGEEGRAPSPPPKSNYSSRSGNSLFSSRHSNESNDIVITEKPSRQRKMPPPMSQNSSLMSSSRFSDLDIEIPYSADSIGAVDEKSLHTRNHKLPTLPNGLKEDEVFQSKYHAPKPDKKLLQRYRLESGMVREGDLNIEPGASDYRGDGLWGVSNLQDEFSPSRFGRPRVPAKTPIGLTNEEYYVIDKKSYLKDLTGNRE